MPAALASGWRAPPQVEAVFNRGLKLASERKDPTLLSLRLSGAPARWPLAAPRGGVVWRRAPARPLPAGDSARLKSFVRWAQRGPPLERAERVVVTWS